MKIISVNVSLPRTVLWKKHEVTTAIFKEPVEGPMMVRRLNLDGDRQADLAVHGGPAKAIYAYPSEHYLFWRSELPAMDLPWGMFGENLTIEGLREEETRIGDLFQVGKAVLMAKQPRIPCYKLAVKFGRDDILERFLKSMRSGVYFSVVKEGLVQAGDSVERIHQDENGITVTDIQRLYTARHNDVSLMHRAAELPSLPEGWRDYFRRKLALAER